jgi:hypothetical protein
MQARMAANRTVDAQTYLGQLAAIEQSVWNLTGDPSWRVSGGNYEYPDPTREPDPKKRIIYNRTVVNSLISQYTDTIVISVGTPNALTSVKVNRPLQYNISTPILIRKPGKVCVDSAGNIYFADIDNHSVWKIDVLGAITLVAGNGTSGFSGDGGQATNATLNSPQGVAVDGTGNVYIADTGNNRIRKVTTTGNINTEVNNSGIPGYSGDDVPTMRAIDAQIKSPQGIWIGPSGNIYFADTGNHRIRQVRVSDNKKIFLMAGTGTAGYSGDSGAATAAQLTSPNGGWMDALGYIYIADTGNNRIRKFTVGGNISTVAGTGTAGYSGDGGLATSAQINNPYGVWVDASRNIYIADAGNHRIRMVTTAGAISTVAGTGTPGHAGDGGAANIAQIDSPSGVCGTGPTTMIISDTMNGCLRKVVAGTISTWPLTMVPKLKSPKGIAVYYDDAIKTLFLFIADQENHRIRRLNTVTNAVVTVAGTGIVYSPGDPTGDDGPATVARLNSPQDVCVAGGNLYIADTNSSKIRKVTSPTATVVGNITTIAGTGTELNKPQGISADGAGNIYIADTENNRIRKVTTAGAISTVVNTSGAVGSSGDGGDATTATLNKPQGVFVDGTGNIYIADTGNHRIRKVMEADGIINTVAGTSIGYSGNGGVATAAQLNSPAGVSVDAALNIYIADTGNHALRLVNNPGAAINPGVITTMAGTGTSGYNLDNQPAVQAWLNSPRGIALGLTKGGGRIYIGDTGNNRIRTLFLKTEQKVYGP